MSDLDLFAGPGGWDVAAAALGRDVLGIDIDADACSTARAAGHARLTADVAALDPATMFDDRVELLIASPPCQSFSTAGKLRGVSRPVILDAVDRIARGHDARAVCKDVDDMLDDGSAALVLEPLRWAIELRPDVIACEQVPGVLPLWEAIAAVLAADGYSTWTGCLDAERYDVPQTRRRAFLIARRHTASIGAPPAPRRRYRKGVEQHDSIEGEQWLAPWISMAGALGWDADDLVGFPRRADRTDIITIGGVDYRERDLRRADTPAFALTEKARSWSRFPADVYGMTRVADQTGEPVDVTWPLSRPSTTVAGRGMVQHPGATANRFNGSRKSRNDGIRVRTDEAAVLQTFPADYPWQGTRTSQYHQIGNAVPPRLACHVLAHALDYDVPT